VFKKPIPKDRKDALLRDLVTSIPAIGELLLVMEAIEAAKQKEFLAAILYILNVLPGPTLPATHLIVYELGKGEKEGLGG
jgi:hypothetical protein